MIHFSQSGLIFNIETSKSFNGLGGLFGSHFGLTSVSLGLTLVIKTVLFGLSFSAFICCH
jgi:hypothetical protein